MLVTEAPSTLRIPISFVRCTVMKEARPNNPREKATTAFIKNHPKSWVSLDILVDRSFLIEDVVEFESCFNGLSDQLKNSTDGKTLSAKLEVANKTMPGKSAIAIKQKTPSDKLVSLASLKGKYVLVEFWASWCGPCREDFPDLVKFYNKYKNNNFEIYAVSLDNKKALWIQAIEEDKLPWIHVSDLKGWQNEAAGKYGISAIPQNILIDPAGIIIAKNLYGEELDKKLGSLLKL